MKKSGIYIICNLITKDEYIGSSINIARRIKNHKRELVKNIHINQHLQNAWNKYGEENFEFKLLKEIENPNKFFTKQEFGEILIDYEQYYFNTLKPKYNICRTAGTTLGAEFYKTERHRHLMSRCHAGIKYSNERNKKISLSMKGSGNPMFGRKHTEAAKLKNSLTQKGRKLSDEQKKKISSSLKGRKAWNKGFGDYFNGEKNPFYGQKHSEETKQKIGKSLKGKIRSEETKNKISKSQKLRWLNRKRKKL